MKKTISDFIEYRCSIDNRIKKEKLCGIDKKDIDGLKSIVGYPLPYVYREFLLKIGNSFDYLDICFRNTLLTNIEIIKEYNEYIITTGQPFEPCSFIFAIVDDEIGMEIGMYYSCEQDDPKVVEMCDNKIMNTLSDSFIKFLFQQAFLHISVLYDNMLVAFIDNTKDMDGLTDLLIDLDFLKQWFSDSKNYLGIKRDKSVMFIKEEYEDVNIIYILY